MSEFSNSEEGHSIYIQSSPLNAKVHQVKEEFKKFESIKPGGVQVRNHKSMLEILKFYNVHLFEWLLTFFSTPLLLAD